MAKHRVLSTKKILLALKQTSAQHGIEIIEKEFIIIRPILDKEKSGKISTYLRRENVNAVFTSANAVDVLQAYLAGAERNQLNTWSIFCLSEQTHKALSRYVPEKNIIETADDALSLAKKIIKHELKQVVFFCGNKRRDELPSFLTKNGVEVEEITVYETTEVPTLVTDDLEGILFFSPSAADSYFSLNELKINTICFATGTTTAGAIAKHTNNQIIISEKPGQEAMIQTLIKYFTKRITEI